jgi:hypothetical protein
MGRVSVWMMKTFWTRTWWWLPNIMNVFNATELYTIKWLKLLRCMLCVFYMKKKGEPSPGMVVHTCNLSTWKVGGSRVSGQPVSKDQKKVTSKSEVNYAILLPMAPSTLKIKFNSLTNPQGSSVPMALSSLTSHPSSPHLPQPVCPAYQFLP